MMELPAFILTTTNCFELIPVIIPRANGAVIIRTGSGKGRLTSGPFPGAYR